MAPEPVSPFKPDTLRGKVALITGGGSGIGYEITRQLGECAAPCLPIVWCRRGAARRPCCVCGALHRVLSALPAGLHGAKVVISGRREQVLRDACAALGGEGVTAHFVQASPGQCARQGKPATGRLFADRPTIQHCICHCMGLPVRMCDASNTVPLGRQRSPTPTSLPHFPTQASNIQTPSHQPPLAGWPRLPAGRRAALRGL